ncbi:phage terminase large subunit family protein [Actinomadura opuntiae]|uniref:phage terminase large subunit family protein n=1 Tax=Actinomadura sp. OS1-43 TaxID=604315 RepID=UPI00255AF45D|nr:terminase family protein [Actinomadura sp. OS1-43]MDL4812806.1 terminase family protein [Actinomadura sp. OS1-43]
MTALAPTLNPVVGVADAIRRQFAAPPPQPAQFATPGALAVALDPTTVQTPALDVIDRELVALADGDSDRLMIFMPPQEGKSVRTSQRFVEWVLKRDPSLRVAIVSYADEMARRWGSDIKLDVETFNGEDGTVDLGLRLRADSRAAGRWQIGGHRGGVYCVGVAGALTGKPVDLLVIDDPIKDLEQAQSATYRERAWRFWQAVAIPRLGPGSKCVLIQTRWHEDDLAGRLLANEPGRWRVVSIPAIAESKDDPLGRKPGEPMISARGTRDWASIRASVGEYVWAALYQQRPAPAAGGLFKRAHLRYWTPMPADTTRHGLAGGRRLDLAGRTVMLDDCWRFLTVDLAASTKTSADYTAVGAWAISLDGDLILLEAQRARIEEAQHWDLVRPLREQWAADTVFVESRMFGTTMVIDATRAGVPVAELQADTDKITRALPATARASTARLWLPAGDTGADVRDELLAFPNSAHDDYVDVVSYAARVQAAHWLPQEKADDRAQRLGQARPDDSPITQAYEAATGTAAAGDDFMSLNY